MKRSCLLSCVFSLGLACIFSGCTDEITSIASSGRNGISFRLAKTDNHQEMTRSSMRCEPVALPITLNEKTDTLYLNVRTSSLPDPEATSAAATRGTPVFTENFADVLGSCKVWGEGGSTQIPVREFTCQQEGNVNILCNAGNAYPDDLYWPEDDVMFYLTAPNEQSGVSNLTTSTTGGKPSFTFDFTTPSSTTSDGAAVAQQDILFAACQAGEKDFKGKPASQLPKVLFYHALTGIKFTLRSDLDPNVRIDAIEFSNVYSAGHCVLTPYYYTSSAWSNPNNTGGTNGTKSAACAVWTAQSDKASYKQAFVANDNGRTAPSYISSSSNELNGTNMEKTFFLIPQTLGSDAEIVLTFTNTANNRQETKRVSLSGVEWQAGMLYDYTISATPALYNADYTLEVTMPETHYSFAGGKRRMDITSYKNNGTSTEDTYYELQWLKNGNWTKFGTSSSRPSGVDATFYGDRGTTSTAKETKHVYIKMDKTDAASTGGTQIACTLQGAPIGTSSAPIDLSKYDADGNYSDSNPHSTANCYIVSQPGWYKFPLIYGNAVERDNVNTSSYQPTVTNAGYGSVLTSFVGHDDQPIASPYIEEHLTGSPNLSASIVWMDGSSSLVQSLSLPANTQINEEVAGQSVKYIKFKVPNNSPEGNALIALKAGDDIVWSWHIWITSMDVRHGAENSDGTNEYRFMQNTLGSIYNANTVRRMPARDVTVRVVQKESQSSSEILNVSDEFVLHQNASVFGRSYSLYYQFGRKDPLPRPDNEYSPCNQETSTELWDGVSTDPVRWGNQNLINNTSGSTIGLSIKNPSKAMSGYYTKKRQGWWLYYNDDPVLNLWSGTLNKIYDTEHNITNPSNDSGSLPNGLNKEVTGRPTELTDPIGEENEYVNYYNPGNLDRFVKTIYDPSPYGYQVPPMLSLKGFRHNEFNFLDTYAQFNGNLSIIVSGSTETYLFPEGNKQTNSNIYYTYNNEGKNYFYLSDMWDRYLGMYVHTKIAEPGADGDFGRSITNGTKSWYVSTFLIFCQDWGCPEYGKKVLPVRIFYGNGSSSGDEPSGEDNVNNVSGNHESIGQGGDSNEWSVQ